jgi:hypothetical protein
VPFSEKIPRVKAQFVMIILTTLVCLLFLIDMGAVLETFFLSLIRFILGKSMVSLVPKYILFVFLAVESFPPHIQASAFGII